VGFKRRKFQYREGSELQPTVVLKLDFEAAFNISVDLFAIDGTAIGKS